MGYRVCLLVISVLFAAAKGVAGPATYSRDVNRKIYFSPLTHGYTPPFDPVPAGQRPSDIRKQYGDKMSFSCPGDSFLIAIAANYYTKDTNVKEETKAYLYEGRREFRFACAFLEEGGKLVKKKACALSNDNPSAVKTSQSSCLESQFVGGLTTIWKPDVRNYLLKTHCCSAENHAGKPIIRVKNSCVKSNINTANQLFKNFGFKAMASYTDNRVIQNIGSVLRESGTFSDRIFVGVACKVEAKE